MKWPADHPNAQILAFVEGSKLVTDRARRIGAPLDGVLEVETMLAKIEELIGQMTVGKTTAEIQALVNEVVPIVNEAVGRMAPIQENLLKTGGTKTSRRPG